jgi:outer membrane protein
MSMRVRSILLLLIVVTVSAPAQTGSSPGRYTLKECIRVALDRNFDIRETYASSRAAAASLTQAFGQYLPGADFSATYSRQLTNLNEQVSIVNGVPIRGEPLPNTYTMNGTLMWTLFNGFRREAQYDAAKNNVDAAENDIQFQRLLVAYNVSRQYIEVLRTEQIVQARKENLSLSRITYDRVKALYDNGRAPITQLLSQETEVANQETSVIQAENEYDLAKVNLLVLMCVDPTQQVTFDPSSMQSDATSLQVDEFRRTIGPERASVQRAMDSRPDIQALQDREQAAAATITQASAGYWPTLMANGGYVWRNFEFNNFSAQGQWYVGLNFRLPLFDQFNTNLNIENARFNHAQSQLNLERLEQQIGQNVRRAYLQLQAAEKGLDITERAMKSALANFDAMQERFNVGGSQLVEVQQANYQLITARINRVTAVYAYLDARTFVEFATGMFREP